MPAEALPFVCAIVAFFLTFIVGVGGAALWSGMPVRHPSATPDRHQGS